MNWASRVSAARKSGKIPQTQELYGYRTHRGYEIKLVDIPAWRLAELTPLHVAARLTKPHAVVAALQKQPQPMGLTKPLQGRALRIIQTLITATEAQGHKAALGTTRGAPPPHRPRKAQPHFTIPAQGESVGFLVLQEQDRSEHVPTDKELDDAKKYSWMRIARFDYTPSSRLRFMLRGGSPRRASEWTDLPDRPLEEQLADLLQTSKPERYSKSAGKPPCRKPAPPTPTPTASSTSENRQTPGTQASRLTEYIAAVRDHATSLPPGQERTEIEAWLVLADAHLQHLTESVSAPKLPTPPKPGGDDLKPFLRHWSPYGPRSY